MHGRSIKLGMGALLFGTAALTGLQLPQVELVKPALATQADTDTDTGEGEGSAGELFMERQERLKREKAERARKKRRDAYRKKRLEAKIAQKDKKAGERLRSKARNLLDEDSELSSLEDTSVTYTIGRGKNKYKKTWDIGGGGWVTAITKYLTSRPWRADDEDFVRRYVIISAKYGHRLDEMMSNRLKVLKDRVSSKVYDAISGLLQKSATVREYMDKWVEWKRAEITRVKQGLKSATKTEEEAFDVQESSGKNLSEDDQKIIKSRTFRNLYLKLTDPKLYKEYLDAKDKGLVK